VSRRALAALALVAAVAAPAAAEEVKTIPTRPGVTQSFILLRRSETPVATVILFAGGNGALGLGPDGRMASLGGNFLVRNRARFAEAYGFMVAVPDAPSDHAGGLSRFRASREHAEDIRALIATLRAKAPAPVWLIGTSMGTVSAANGAARLRESGPDGLVLTSTITRWNKREGESVSDVKLRDIAIPTLVVHHREDACPFTPFADIPGLVRDLSKAPRRELIAFEGGAPPQSGPCEARAAHGYLGLDAEVVKAIADWIVATPRP
jgi:pimeloyl-ACP methyl ester carboxylesterase